MNLSVADHWPLGVFTSIDAGLGVNFDVLADLQLTTIQLHAPKAERRSPEEVAEVTERLQRLGIRVTCVFAGFAGESYADIPTVERTVGLVPAETREERVKELLEIADFASQLGVKAVGLHLGFVPHDPKEETYQQVVQMMREVCDYCDKQDQAIHLETGQEPADVLEGFLETVGRENLFVNFDPANMILYGCGEPLPALERIGRFVRSVHCKDAKWSDRPGETWGTEVALGEGDVDFTQFMRILEMIRYTGPLTIEREIPQNPARQLEEIGSGVELLRRTMQSLNFSS
ncbi:sugar phosphate isomerase/epimerase family protein [Bythopirellula polymerisocia]|uniref:Xylose isomerase-like TIM barrel n=1 Tax=Bythopirellula polymerisocia TaxID=2528003 RepID=A0A5C6CR10_9BACT|nr:sugar phosphate isomerase/epimerase family protein [Bythopirellula polymerisocia]TWU27363.1 Xylose isomerase-like TIM barrel [Bythopirellula polymerisocia]